MSKKLENDVLEEESQIKGGVISEPHNLLLEVGVSLAQIFLVVLLALFIGLLIHIGMYTFNDSYYCSMQGFNTTQVWERCSPIWNS